MSCFHVGVDRSEKQGAKILIILEINLAADDIEHRVARRWMLVVLWNAKSVDFKKKSNFAFY